MNNSENSTYKKPSTRADSSVAKVRMYIAMPYGYPKRFPLYNFTANQHKFTFKELAQQMEARLLKDKNKFGVVIFYENKLAGYSGKEIYRVQGNLK